MMTRRWIGGAVVAVAGAALLTLPAAAHHSSTPFYDATKSVEIAGKVTKFLIRNPHSFILIEVTEKDGVKSLNVKSIKLAN